MSRGPQIKPPLSGEQRRVADELMLKLAVFAVIATHVAKLVDDIENDVAGAGNPDVAEALRGEAARWKLVHDTMRAAMLNFARARHADFLAPKVDAAFLGAAREAVVDSIERLLRWPTDAASVVALRDYDVENAPLMIEILVRYANPNTTVTRRKINAQLGRRIAKPPTPPGLPRRVTSPLQMATLILSEFVGPEQQQFERIVRARRRMYERTKARRLG